MRNFVKEVELRNIAVFLDNRFSFVDGINVLTGKNSTGKTFFMRLIYSTLSALKQAKIGTKKSDLEVYLRDKLQRVFLIGKVGKLITRGVGAKNGLVELRLASGTFCRFSLSASSVKVEDYALKEVDNPVYIPSKEVLSLMDRGIISSLEKNLFMEEVYLDLAKKLDIPAERKGVYNEKIDTILRKFKVENLSKISRKDREFFVHTKDAGSLESKLLAEGYRKIVTLVYLIQNGELTNGAYLFWDEPETNLNPELYELVVELLFFLAKELKVQVFISTHDYFIMKQLYTKHKTMKDEVSLKFFTLQTENNRVYKTENDSLYDLENSLRIKRPTV